MTNRITYSIIAVLLAAVAAMAWKFLVAGSTLPADDGRVAIVLDPGERAFVLAEMRGFVAGLERISDALARDDMKGVADAARPLGAGRTHDVPMALMGKLPLEFKTLALATHRSFDALAADAQDGGTPKKALSQLADVLQKCVACHAAYQFATPQGT